VKTPVSKVITCVDDYAQSAVWEYPVESIDQARTSDAASKCDHGARAVKAHA
jgi:hypothetical protein